MRLVAYDPFVSVEHAGNLQVGLLPLDSLLQEADFITLYLPLTESTKNLIVARELELVKPGVRIINCARGGLIDEAALVKTVNEKRVAGAAVDVFPKEPTTESPLFESDRIIVTPHLGASTTERPRLWFPGTLPFMLWRP
jgi:D-3-phosphoglycerate dehydrogenase